MSNLRTYGITGQYEVFMDEKKRIKIPKKWEEALGKEISIFEGQEEILCIYRSDRLLEDIESKLTDIFDENVRSFKRRFFSSIKEISLDSYRRFIMPADIIKEKNFSSSVLLVGAGDCAEI